MKDEKQKTVYAAPELEISMFDHGCIVCASMDEAGAIPDYVLEEW